MDPLHDARVSRGLGGRFYGMHVAVVTDLVDPQGQGRVRVRLPWSPDTDDGSYEPWARLATMMAGNDRGSWFIPDVEDEVLVGFESGDPRRPIVMGALWNGVDAPPEEMDSGGENQLKVLKSRTGVKMTMDDTGGSERLQLETPAGQTVTLTDPGTIEIRDANGNSVTLDSSGVTLVAASTLTIQASTIDVSAGSVSVNSGISTFSGVVKADVVIANSVVSSSYTPGAGNIW